MSQNKPKFIVIEGGEGSGKSSMLIKLKEKLGDKVVTTREPGGSPYAEAIREVAKNNPLAKAAPTETTLCLMFAARYDNLANMIIPTIEKGITIIADRFDASSYAYQVHSQSGGGLEGLFWKLRQRMSLKPDLYIFFDAKPEVGIRRASTRNQSLLKDKKYDHFDDREMEFHKKVRAGYLKFLKNVPHVVIDANKSIEEVEKDFANIINKLI